MIEVRKVRMNPEAMRYGIAWDKDHMAILDEEIAFDLYKQLRRAFGRDADDIPAKVCQARMEDRPTYEEMVERMAYVLDLYTGPELEEHIKDVFDVSGWTEQEYGDEGELRTIKDPDKQEEARQALYLRRLLETSGGYIRCNCGHVLRTFSAVTNHWQRGHFYETDRQKEEGSTDE